MGRRSRYLAALLAQPADWLRGLATDPPHHLTTGEARLIRLALRHLRGDPTMTKAQRELFRERFAGMDAEERIEMLSEWNADGGCEAACPHQCWVEPDGECEHGAPSWLIVLGWI